MAIDQDEVSTAMPVDGGAQGSGLAPHLTHDPTQGVGTSAWQESLRANAALNARIRRN